MARRKVVKPVDLNKAVEQVLSEYGDEVYEVMSECIEEVSEEATIRLQEVTQFSPGGNPSGEYSQSWVNEQLSGKPLVFTKVVHNQEHYRLTHLLEKGHVVKNGTGRIGAGKKTRTDAYPHIAPVNEWANNELPKLVERKIENDI